MRICADEKIKCEDQNMKGRSLWLERFGVMQTKIFLVPTLTKKGLRNRF